MYHAMSHHQVPPDPLLRAERVHAAALLGLVRVPQVRHGRERGFQGGEYLGMVDSRYLVLVDSRYLVLVDIQISVTEARAAGLVQLIVFMYSSNRRPGPASVMLLLWDNDDGNDIEAGEEMIFQSNHIHVMRTSYLITQIPPAVCQ